MQRATLLMVTALLVAGCQKETLTTAPQGASINPNVQSILTDLPRSASPRNVAQVDLNQIEIGSRTTKFGVSLQDAQKQPVGPNSPLQPNTTYRVVVQGESPAQFVLKMAENFEVIQYPASVIALNAVYLIKTNATVSTQLYLSVVPLHMEHNVLTKERPSGFLLPN